MMKIFQKLICDAEPAYRQRSVQENGENRPRDIYDVMAVIAGKITKSDRYEYINSARATRETLAISWAPSWRTLMLSVFGENLFYLCWGVPRGGNAIVRALKLLKLKLILRRSSLVFVNEEATAQDVRWLANVNPVTIPYVVDGTFFSLGDEKQRGPYVLVPGNNDRDEELVRALALEGLRVVRVSRDHCIRDVYQRGDFPSRVEFHFNVPPHKVRDLYRGAMAVALPLATDNHASGQTAILEAISCGCPVVLSKGRTSTIFQDLPTVIVVEGRDLDTWNLNIERAFSMHIDNSKVLNASSEIIAKRHSPEAVAATMIESILEHI